MCCELGGVNSDTGFGRQPCMCICACAAGCREHCKCVTSSLPHTADEAAVAETSRDRGEEWLLPCMSSLRNAACAVQLFCGSEVPERRDTGER